MRNIYSSLIYLYLFLATIKNIPLVVNYHVIQQHEVNYYDLSIMTMTTLMLGYSYLKGDFYKICIYILF